MKFILLVEESGYQVKYWDETTDTIGRSFASSWNVKRLHEKLNSKGFNINYDELQSAVSLIERGEPFIVLSSEPKNINLDTFINNLFKIDYGK